jgi:hypothetical protein
MVGVNLGGRPLGKQTERMKPQQAYFLVRLGVHRRAHKCRTLQPTKRCALFLHEGNVRRVLRGIPFHLNSTSYSLNLGPNAAASVQGKKDLFFKHGHGFGMARASISKRLPQSRLGRRQSAQLAREMLDSKVRLLERRPACIQLHLEAQHRRQ